MPARTDDERAPLLRGRATSSSDAEAQDGSKTTKDNSDEASLADAVESAVLALLSDSNEKDVAVTCRRLRDAKGGNAAEETLKARLSGLVGAAADGNDSFTELPLDLQILFLCSLMRIISEISIPQTNSRLSLARTLKMASQRRKTQSTLCRLVRMNLDSLWSEANDGETLDGEFIEDNLVQVVYKALPQRKNSEFIDISLIDFLLGTVTLPKSDDLRSLVLHPVVLAATECVWEMPCTNIRDYKPSSYYYLHAIYYTIYVTTSIILALTATSAHYFHFNPLRPRFAASFTGASIVWILWFAATIGWLLFLLQSLVNGPLPFKSNKKLPLPPGSYVALMAHSFLAVFLLLRTISFGQSTIYLVAYTLLAWSVPLFLLGVFVLPAGLPLISPTCARISQARFRALRVINERIAAFSPLVPFLLVTLAALFYAVNGEVERYEPKPSIFFATLLALFFAESSKEHTDIRTVSPIEARSALAVALLLVLLLGWLIGDSNAVSITERAAEIESAAFLERIRTVRLFSPRLQERPFLPPPLNLFGLVFRQSAEVVASLAQIRHHRVYKGYIARIQTAELTLLSWQLAVVEWLSQKEWQKRRHRRS